MGTAIDISNYTGRLDDRQLRWLQDEAELVVVRLSTEDSKGQRDIAAQQVDALAGAGIAWQGYLWCYWDESPYVHWQRAQEKLPPGWPKYHQLGIWLDMEDAAPPGMDPLDWVGAYAQMLRVDGFVPGVYTGRWWLDAHRWAQQGERGRYWSQYPLWWASYGVEPSCQPGYTHPWTAVAMHQYRSVESGSVLNSYDLSLICDVP